MSGPALERIRPGGLAAQPGPPRPTANPRGASSEASVPRPSTEEGTQATWSAFPANRGTPRPPGGSGDRGVPPSMARVALERALPGPRALRRRATLPKRIKRRYQSVGRIPATVDAGRALDKPPLVVGRLNRVQRLPGRRGRLVELPERFGDCRAVLFKHRDRDRQLGPDVVWDQVGKVARLRHASTSSKENAQPTSPFRPSPDAGFDGRDNSQALDMRLLTSAAGWVTSRRGTRRRARAVIGQADGTKRLKELAAQNARPKRLLAEAELEKDVLGELTKGSL
jgi:hypothetical protein